MRSVASVAAAAALGAALGWAGLWAGPSLLLLVASPVAGAAGVFVDSDLAPILPVLTAIFGGAVCAAGLAARRAERGDQRAPLSSSAPRLS